MDSNFAEEIEKLAYRVLLWGLLIPKTLFRVIFEPQWVPGYVKEQVNNDTTPAFDKYISPVILFLVVTLIPAIALSFVPPVGISVLRPTARSDENLRDMTFTVRGDFRSSTGRVFHRVWWELYEVQLTDQAGNPAFVTYNYNADRSVSYFDEKGNIVDNPDYVFLFGNLQDEAAGVYDLVQTDSNEIVSLDEQLYPSEMTIVDANTIEDYFYIDFVPGEYQARVIVENYDPASQQTLETFSDTIYITVPEDETKPIYFDSTYMVDGEDITAGTAHAGSFVEGLKSGLESGTVYFLAFGLLSLPLLFSFGTKRLGPDGIGETSMKETFYMQCYYFAPVTATIWALIYTFMFTTPDILFSMDLVLSSGIVLLMILWFWNAETNAIMRERNVSRFRAWIILLILGAALLVGGGVILAVAFDADILRRYSILFYPLFGGLIFVLYVITRIRNRMRSQQKTVEVTPVNPLP